MIPLTDPFLLYGTPHLEPRPVRLDAGRLIADLSGGNLQKVVIGREFAGEPRALVVAAPTRGLDVGAIENVHELLRAAAARGVAVLMISEDLDEILALADRVLVMYEGTIVGERDGEGADVDELGMLMAGGAPR